MREVNEQQDDKNFQSFEQFIEVVKQQQLNPGILPYQKELFDQIKDLVNQQKSKLKEYLKYNQEYEATASQKNFKYVIYNAEVQKIDYLLKMYLKIRLKKIQTFCFYLLKNQNQAERLLSNSQLSFMKKYGELRYQYYKDNNFKYLLKHFRDFKGVEMILGRTEEEKRQRKLFVDTKQSQIEIIAPNFSQYCFTEIIRNPYELRFGINVSVSNLSSEHIEVISQGAIIFGPLKSISEQFGYKDYKLI